MIDFFGSGYDAAESLGLLSDLEQIHYPIASLSFLDREDREKLSVPYKRPGSPYYQLIGQERFIRDTTHVS
jgi:hypothetical protein